MGRFRSFIFTTIAILFSATTAGAQTQSELLAGAFTDVPPAAQPPEYVSLVDGSPLHILSAVTGVEFHVPGKVSSEPGGLSPLPQPILRKANGVEYWFISGEFSGYVTEENGQHIVIGPIDPSGVNHHNETFCSVCSPDFEGHPLCCPAEAPAAHPRAGLHGAFFALSIPVEGFNGAMIQTEPAGDAGFNLPSAPMLWNPVDPTLLLQRGYAVFTMAPGGSVPRGMLEDQSLAVDTNPYSGSGIFWGSGFENPEFIVPYTRFSYFDAETEVETALPSDFFLSLQISLPPGEEQICVDEWGCDLQGTACFCPVPFGHPEFVYGSFMIFNPEIIGDSAIFAKNLMAALFAPVSWTAYIGWSGSGTPAMLLNSSTHGGNFPANRSAGPQAAGGNYNVWGDSGSGLRFDAFLSYAGFKGVQAYNDHPEDLPDVNPNFPASAPLVWFVPGNDTGTSGAEPSAAYRYANKVWKALDDLGRGKEVNDFLRIYSLPQATHQHRSQVFASFDDRDDPANGLWFEYSDIFPNLGALNEEGRGYRINAAYAESLRYNPPDGGWDFYYQGLVKDLRDAPLWLQTLANLRKYSEQGTPLPISRVDPRIFNNIKTVSTETVLPDYPVIEFPFPDPYDFDTEVALVNEFAHSITEDSGVYNYHLREDEVEAFKIFANSNQLKYSTEPFLLPDTLPLGRKFYYFDMIHQVPFTKKEFKARYGSHLGYVAAFSKLTFKLIGERLWDPKMGIEHILAALKTPVILASGDTAKGSDGRRQGRGPTAIQSTKNSVGPSGPWMHRFENKGVRSRYQGP